MMDNRRFGIMLAVLGVIVALAVPALWDKDGISFSGLTGDVWPGLAIIISMLLLVCALFALARHSRGR